MRDRPPVGRLRRSARLRRPRRGVGIIWFAGVTLPIILLATGLAVDVNTMAVAQNEASNLAYSAALAGAFQFAANPNPSTGLIDTSAGPAAALSTINAGEQAGAMAAARVDQVPAPVISSIDYANDEITVTITYHVTGLIVMGYFLGTGSNSPEQTVTRSAFVCIPGDSSGPTGGYCVTPQS